MMIARSSDERNAAISKKQTAEALTIAEAGIQRTLSYLSLPQNSDYVRGDYVRGKDEKWHTTGDQNNFDFCKDEIKAKKLKSGKINSGASEETYKITNYEPNLPSEATITVEAEYKNALSRVQVQTFVNQELVFPSFYFDETVNLGNNDIQGNIICKNCQQPNSDGCNNDGSLSEAGRKSSFGANDNATVNGEAFLGDIMSDKKKDKDFDDSVPSFPGTDKKDAYEIKIDKKGKPDLPRSSDDSYKDGIYHYQVENITLNGSDLNIDPPNKNESVYLYVSGDITVNGSAKISYDGPIDQFRIYGTGSDQTFKINGAPGGVSGFVYAPEATVGINGNGQWNGIIWADKWRGKSGVGSSAQKAKLDSSMVSRNAKEKLTEDFDFIDVGRFEVTTVNSLTDWETIEKTTKSEKTKKSDSNNS